MTSLVIKTPHDALVAAIEIAGDQESLAEKMGITQSAVSQMLKRGKGVTAERVVDAERAVAGKITRAQFRPDLYAAG